MRGVTKKTALLATALLLIVGGSANAQPWRGRAFFFPRAHIYTPFYDPFWGDYPYAGYPYVAGRSYGDVRTEVKPKDAEVYVDGFYAGVVSDFDGAFKRLHLTPGGHAVTFYLEGYRTVTQNVYVRPDATLKMNDTMERLAAGQTSVPPPRPTTRRGQS